MLNKMEKSLALGVDIGGSHITVAMVDLKTKKLLEHSVIRSAIDSEDKSEVILSAWASLIHSALKNVERKDKSIGIAIPGPFDYDKGVSLIKDQAKFRSLYQINVKQELADRLDMPAENIHFINDATGFLHGELFAGAGTKVGNVLGLTLGTGLGSSVCIEQVVSDADLWNSKFIDGIAEDYLSTRWFVNRYYALTGKHILGVKDIVGLENTDRFAVQLFMEFGINLARFLIPVINRLMIDKVILGGNIAKAFSCFAPELIANLKGNKIEVDIKVSELNEHAALVGAASCCIKTNAIPNDR